MVLKKMIMKLLSLSRNQQWEAITRATHLIIDPKHQTLSCLQHSISPRWFHRHYWVKYCLQTSFKCSRTRRKSNTIIRRISGNALFASRKSNRFTRLWFVTLKRMPYLCCMASTKIKKMKTSSLSSTVRWSRTPMLCTCRAMKPLLARTRTLKHLQLSSKTLSQGRVSTFPRLRETTFPGWCEMS